jgi:hypothetical protein
MDPSAVAGDLEAFLLATVASGDAPTQRVLRALAAEADAGWASDLTRTLAHPQSAQ